MSSQARPLKKADVLARLRLLRDVAEDGELDMIHTFAIIDTLLEYIRDQEIRDAVEEIPL